MLIEAKIDSIKLVWCGPHFVKLPYSNIGSNVTLYRFLFGYILLIYGRYIGEKNPFFFRRKRVGVEGGVRERRIRHIQLVCSMGAWNFGLML